MSRAHAQTVELLAQLALRGQPPRPTAAPMIHSGDVQSRRRLDCAWYESCLDLAVALDWEGFSCGQCRAYLPLGDAAKEAQGLVIESYLRTGAEDSE